MTRSRAATSRALPGSTPRVENEHVRQRLRELDEEVKRLEKARLELIATDVAVANSAPDVPDRQDDQLDTADEAISRFAVLASPAEMATYLQQHLGQKLTAYLAGLKDVKTVGQWARGKVEPPAITRERLRTAFQATQLFLLRYGDEAAQGWFFGANSSLGDRAPAAVLREADTPDELALIAPLARAFVRGAH